jgi:hypothetical protein
MRRNLLGRRQRAKQRPDTDADKPASPPIRPHPATTHFRILTAVISREYCAAAVYINVYYLAAIANPICDEAHVRI